MRTYELMYIIRPDLDEEALNGVVDKFDQLITNHGGEVINTNRWGKRRLAYEINDYREGFYILEHFKGNSATEIELERVLKLTDAVLRFLITRKL
ncbi:MAG: 30S ribosomal protein S6 [Syntrophomonadaceae bacterium]|nr:30S ribosomal protein S6 [Syntrophomonadaceae bacterium]